MWFSMKKILVLLGSGGHTVQMLRLLEKVGKKYNYEYVIASDDDTSAKQIKYKGPIYQLYNVRTKKDFNLFKVILKFIPSTIEAIQILLKSKPNAIIGCGPGFNLHILFLANLLGIKVIYFESWVRVKHPSLTGKLIYHFTDLFFVQWRPLKNRFKRAVYAGRLG